MKYRINEVKIRAGRPKSDIPAAIIKKLGKAGRGITITDWRINRQSVDARDKNNIWLVYGVDFDIAPENRKLDLPSAVMEEYRLPERGSKALSSRPVICGFGPAGMYAALILAEAGYAPIVIERGAPMERRIRDVEKFWREGELQEESNVQFGEGGAGTFSDGKLTTNLKDGRISKILEEFVEAGANPEILYLHKPHIGTDVLREVVVNIRKKITELGGEIRFDTRLERINAAGGRLRSIEVSCGGNSDSERVAGGNSQNIRVSGRESYEIETELLVLAPGHSARDTFRMLANKGIEMRQKPFSIGLRIQHPQALINRAQYGEGYEKLDLPPAEYKLSYHCKKAEDGGENDGRGVYTFCMCPGGEVIASGSEKDGIVTNGMSYSSRDGEYANSAVLADVRTADFESDDPLAGIAFQEKYEKLAFAAGGACNKPPQCTFGEFKEAFEVSKAGIPEAPKAGNFNGERAAAGDAEPLTGTAGEKVLGSLPRFAASAIMEAMPYMGRKLAGFDGPEALLFAVESRSSSPVRIPRDEKLNSSLPGLYPCGEGAGYAGGIVSAALDGIRVAEAIIGEFAPAK